MRRDPIPMMAILLLLSFSAASQSSRFDILLRSGTIVPEKNISREQIDRFQSQASRTSGKFIAWIQFDEIPTASVKASLSSQGIELLDYIPNNTYVAVISAGLHTETLLDAKARAIIEPTPVQKMQPELASGHFPLSAVKNPGTVDVLLSYPSAFAATDVESSLRSRAFEIIPGELQQFNLITVRVAVTRLGELASLPFVQYLEAMPGKDEPLNGWTNWGRDAVRVSLVNAPVSQGGKNLRGAGVVIGIGDNADPQQHVDFSERMISRAAASYSFHGTHVTGIAGGAGIADELRTGFAPKSTILSQVFSGVWLNADAYVTDHNMMITNNSYGNNLHECSLFGVYNLYSRILDQQAYSLPKLQNVFSAGNSALDHCLPYPDSFRTVLGGYQSAKNVISVGNFTPIGYIFQQSSRGPVRDGRIKPEICSIGSFIMSTAPPPAPYYAENTGTSMAAPAISGGMALIIERYRQLHPPAIDPPNSLIKALTCNSGDDWGQPGPDFTHGFGVANFYRAVEMLDNNRYQVATIAQGQQQDLVINIPAGYAMAKVMLYWNDPAASVLASRTLVNDLDLEVIDPSSTVRLPLVLDTAQANIKLPAAPGVDHINNIEQVVINNPVAGNYTIRVKGTAITENPSQEYVIVYDLVPVEMKLVSPIGGDSYVPGERMIPRWDSYGGANATFKLEYSNDDGANWTVLNANIPANKRFYFFTSPDPDESFQIPNDATSTARMRLSKNGTGITFTTGQFTVIGAPTIFVSPVQCEGYFAVNWTSVTGATGYDVMMLRGDEMVVVASLPSTSTSYAIGGLSRDSIYWVSVRPTINGKPGRRGTAVSRKPDNGACTGSISDNDIKADSILSPLRSGRKLTSTSLGSAVQVIGRIRNLDDAPTSGNITVSYRVNGGSPVTEVIVNPGIAANGFLDHAFAGTLDLSAVGTYSLEFSVSQIGDPVSSNNTLTKIYKQLDNPAITSITPAAPFLDNFDAAPVQSFNTPQIGLLSLDRYDFMNSSHIGRIRSFVNTGIAHSGNRALTLDAIIENPGTTDSLTGTYNLATYHVATDDIRLDFQYKNHGQASSAANKVWARGDDTKNWVEVYDLDDNQNPADGSYKKTISIELSDLLANATPPQDFSTSFQLRFGQRGSYMAADNESGAGYSFDDIRIYRANDDVQMISIDAPAPISCALTANSTITVTLKNSTNVSLTNVPVRFKVDGGSWMSSPEFVPSVPANGTAVFSFTTTANLASFGQHSISVVADYPTDDFHENDTVTVSLYNAPVITVTNANPYLQNFETGDGSWHAEGKNSSWAYGTPSSQKINRAASGIKAWKTRLTGSYNDLEESYLYSPCFDISGVTSPTLSMSLALDLEDCGNSFSCDGAYMEYSTDGVTWTRLGAAGNGTNWYNRSYPGDNQWSVENYHRWHVATIPLPVSSSTLRLRIAVRSDNVLFREGVGVDDIHIYSNVNGIYTGTGTSPVLNQPAVSGSNWINFIESGSNQLIASINPAGQNLGSTDVQSYVYTGSIRVNSDQYYHNRNITIKPANFNLPDSASVRFYFLDSETEALINATGCSYCFKPSMAYQLGVTKYNDADDTKENGTLADNTLGHYLFIPPAKIAMVPFDKGYYAEFKVKDFCELWLNNGGFDLITPLPVQLKSFSAKKSAGDVLVEWRTATESGTDHFEVEVAKGNQAYQAGQFIKLGDVAARGTSTTEQYYSLLDRELNKTGVRYYRLKTVDKDGSFSYSAVRPVSFTSTIDWTVYPNPSSGKFMISGQVETGSIMNVRVFDQNGKAIKSFNVKGDGFIQKILIDLESSSFAKGLYLAEIEVNGKKETFRLLKQ